MDTETEIQYQLILTLIVGWQVLSSIANLIINPPEQAKTARLAFLGIMILYMVGGHFFLTNVTDRIIDITAFKAKLPLYQSLVELGMFLLAFWYYIICFREIRALLTSVNNQSADNY
jgi:hypothetical protein